MDPGIARSITEAAKGGQERYMKELLKKKANVNAVLDENGCTALMIAAKQDKSHMVRTLVELGANIHAVDKNGNTALTYAASRGHTDTCEMFIEMGVKIQHSAIKTAWDQNYEETVEMLFKNGGNVNTLFDGKSALIVAVERGWWWIANMLIDNNAVKQVFNKGKYQDKLNRVREYDVAKCKRKVRDDADYGKSALVNAVELGQWWIAKILIAEGVDVNTTNKLGCPVLSLALADKHKSTAEMLIEENANRNVLNEHSPLIYAADGGYTSIVRMLLCRHGNVEIASINAVGDHGQTSLIKASIRGHLETVKLLVAEGANMNAQDMSGNTALKYAALKEHESIFIFLWKNGADESACHELHDNVRKWIKQTTDAYILKKFWERYREEIGKMHPIKRQKKQFCLRCGKLISLGFTP